MRKKYCIVAILFLLGCMACGRQEQSGEPAAGSRNEMEDTMGKGEAAEDMEALQRAIEISGIQKSEEELTPDERLSNLILEKIVLERTEEKEDSFIVRVIYPDVGTLLLEEAEKISDYDETVTNEILQNLAEKLEKGEVSYVEEELTIFYATEEKTEIVWSEELMNAMSGGLLELTKK